MFPGAAGGDTRGGVARGLAALSTGIRRQGGVGVDHHHQIPTSNPYRSNNLTQRPTGIQMPSYPTLEQQQRQFATAKRSFAEMQQLQSLQASTLARCVRQRIGMPGSQQVIPIHQQHQQQNQFNYLSFQHPNQLNHQQLQQEQQLHLIQNRQPMMARPQQQQQSQSQSQQQQYQLQHHQMVQNHFFGSSPLSPADSSTLSGTSVSGVTTNAPANLALPGNPNRAHHHQQQSENNTAAGDGSASASASRRQQQQLEFAKVNGFFPCTATSSSGCEGVSELTQSDCGNENGNGNGTGNRNGSSSGTTLEYLEHCLLDDDDDDDLFSEPANASGSEAAAANGHIDWSGTMEDILALTEPAPVPSQPQQPESVSGSESSLTLDEVLTMTVPSPMPQQQQQTVSAQPSVSACASGTASASTPAAATPPPPSPSQHQDQQQQQQNKSPLSPSTPSSSASSSFNPAQPVSPAPLPVPTQQLLSEAAAAIADGNMDQASAVLSEVKKALVATTNNPAADPVEQKLLRYFADALLSRINPAEGGGQAAAASLENQNQGQSPVPDLCGVEHMFDVQRLQEIGLFYRMSISAANLAILESVLGLPRIHIVDFDISGGSQYSALLNSVYSRYRSQGPPPTNSGGGGGGPPTLTLPFIKITAVADPHNPYSANTACPDRLRATGAALAKQAKAMGFGFEFSTVRLTPSELTRDALGCEDPEVVPLIVNFGFLLSKLADESVTPLNPRDELLRRVKSLSPRLVTVVEQEMNCNTAPFLNRFRELSSYYAAAFEAVRVHLSSNVDARVMAQAEAALGRKAANAVAAEGWRRVERCEVLGKWRARFGMAGFKPSPIGRGVVDTIRKLVVGLGQQQMQQQQQNGTGNSGPGAGVNKNSNVSVNVGVEEEGGGVVFGWKGRRLTAVSAWRC